MCWLCLGPQPDKKSEETVTRGHPANGHYPQPAQPTPPPIPVVPQITPQPVPSQPDSPALPRPFPGPSSNVSDSDPWQNGQTQFVSRKYRKIKKIGTGESYACAFYKIQFNFQGPASHMDGCLAQAGLGVCTMQRTGRMMRMWVPAPPTC